MADKKVKEEVAEEVAPEADEADAPAPAPAPATPVKRVAKAKKAKKERRASKAGAGEVAVYDLEGEETGTLKLPAVFHTPIRTDLIRRDIKSIRANRRQPYGAYHRAGMRHSTSWSGKGQGVSRSQRIKGSMRGAQSPEAVGGRRAFPPQVEKIWDEKINRQERLIARRAALAATADAALVRARGHRFDADRHLPILVTDALEEKARTRDLWEVLGSLGLDGDVTRAREGTHVRAGKGKRRGRRFRTPRSLLIVVHEKRGVELGARNLPGVEVATVAELNTELLAPGGDPGRLTIYTKGAISDIAKSFAGTGSGAAAAGPGKGA